MKKIFSKKHKTGRHPEFISGSYQLLNNTLNWSDSENTQSLHPRKDERFGMTIDSDELPYNFSHSLLFFFNRTASSKNSF